MQGGVSHAISEHVARRTRSEHRGFVQRRYLVQNVMSMGTQLRVEGLRGDLLALAEAAFFGFTAAFSSVDRSFLLVSMCRRGIAEAAVVFVDGLSRARTLVTAGEGGARTK